MSENRRIIGIENEFAPFATKKDRQTGVISFSPALPRISKSLQAVFLDFLSKNVPPRYLVDNTKVFSPKNQIYIYIDRENIELTTPECGTPREAVAYDKEIEMMMADAILAINEEYTVHGHIISACKNNYDFSYLASQVQGALSLLATRGTHENYSVIAPDQRYNQIGLKGIEDWLLGNNIFLLASYLATRSIVAGNGCIFGTDQQSIMCNFLLSQRGNFIEKFRDQSTVASGGYDFNSQSRVQVTECNVNNSRSLINLRNEPLGDARHFLRLHLICGDANLAEWSTYLKVGVTSIFLSMMEKRFFDGGLSEKIIFEPSDEHTFMNVFRRTIYDLSFKSKLITVAGNKKLSSLEHQIAIYEAAQEYFRFTTPCEWEKDVMEKWGYVLARIEANDIQALSDKLDWAIKLNYITKYMQRHNITHYSDPRVRMLDFQYHELHPERSIFKKLQDKQKIQTILTPEEREYAKNNPPNTRAMWRKIIISALTERQLELFGEVKHRIDGEWDIIKCGRKITLRCDDPFAEEMEQLVKFHLAEIRAMTKGTFTDRSNDYSDGPVYSMGGDVNNTPANNTPPDGIDPNI